jgi:hypothetical protein
MAVVGCRSSMHTAGARYATHAVSRWVRRYPGPSREGLEVAEWLVGDVGLVAVLETFGDLHLPIATRGGGPPLGLE